LRNLITYVFLIVKEKKNILPLGNNSG
jgi:hypothetical protein